jgi:hypothetical protein
MSKRTFRPRPNEKTFRNGEGGKRILGELKAYLRPPRTIPIAILLVEINYVIIFILVLSYKWRVVATVHILINGA